MLVIRDCHLARIHLPRFFVVLGWDWAANRSLSALPAAPCQTLSIARARPKLQGWGRKGLAPAGLLPVGRRADLSGSRSSRSPPQTSPPMMARPFCSSCWILRVVIQTLAEAASLSPFPYPPPAPAKHHFLLRVWVSLLQGPRLS